MKLRPPPDERFEAFDRENPEVYRLFVKYANMARARGMKCFSAGTILDIIRWEESGLSGDDGFKVNNDYAAPMARRLIREQPSFADFFELRRTRTDRQLEEAQAAGRLC